MSTTDDSDSHQSSISIDLPLQDERSHPDPLLSFAWERSSIMRKKNLVDLMEIIVKKQRSHLHLQVLLDAISREKEFRKGKHNTSTNAITTPWQNYSLDPHETCWNQSPSPIQSLNGDRISLPCSAVQTITLDNHLAGEGKSDYSSVQIEKDIELPVASWGRTEIIPTDDSWMHSKNKSNREKRRCPPSEWDWSAKSFSSSVWDTSSEDADEYLSELSLSSRHKRESFYKLPDHYRTKKSIRRRAMNFWPQGFALIRDIDASKIKSTRKFQSVEVLCPYPSWIEPQIQVIDCLIDCLVNSRHGILESPTGTGKTAGLLCGVLAWQRNIKLKSAFESSKDNSTFDRCINPLRGPIVYFCTRTHSQISQVVKELKKLPYNPVAVCLGSPKHLCPYADLFSFENFVHGEYYMSQAQREKSSREAINRELPESFTTRMLRGTCRAAVATVERNRRRRIYSRYEKSQQQQLYYKNEVSEGEGFSLITEGDIFKGIQQEGCPFYAALGTERYGTRIANAILPPIALLPERKDTCELQENETVGGRMGQASYDSTQCSGIWDIEEMKRFASCSGTSTYQKWIAAGWGCPENLVPSNNTVAFESPRQNASSQQAEEGDTPGCPYYTAHALCRVADLVILPYQLILCPYLKFRHRLPLRESVIIFDEAHNIESTCREEASGAFSMETLQEYLHTFEVFIEGLSGRSPEDFYRDAAKPQQHCAYQRRSRTDRLNLRVAFSEITYTYFKQPHLSGCVQLLTLAAACWLPFRDLFQQCNDLSHEQFFRLRSKVKSWGKDGINSRRRGCVDFFEEFEIDQRAIAKIQDELIELNTMVHQWLDEDIPHSHNISAKQNGHLRRILTTFRRASTMPHFIDVVTTIETIHLSLRYPRCYISSLWKSSMRPGVMEDIAREAHSVFLASGTLSPFDPLISELGPTFASRLHGIVEAPHVVPRGNLMGLILPSVLTRDEKFIEAKCTHENLTNAEFIITLGLTVSHIIRHIPGGILVFLPSYKLLDVIGIQWNKQLTDRQHQIVSIIDQLRAVKGTVIIEPRRNEQFKVALDKYRRAIDTDGHAIFIGIYRAKLSEGLSMKDEYVRGVISIGIPYPTLQAPSILRKRHFNNQLITQRLKPEDIIKNPADNSRRIPQKELEMADSDHSLPFDVHATPSRTIQTRTEMERGQINLASPPIQRFQETCEYLCTLSEASATRSQRQPFRCNWIDGNTWYTLQAYRAINQAIGRVIRHKNDHGLFILVDSRHLNYQLKDSSIASPSCLSDSHIKSRITAWHSLRGAQKDSSKILPSPEKKVPFVAARFCKWIRPFLQSIEYKDIASVLTAFFHQNVRQLQLYRHPATSISRTDQLVNSEPNVLCLDMSSVKTSCSQPSITDVENSNDETERSLRKPQEIQ